MLNILYRTGIFALIFGVCGAFNFSTRSQKYLINHNSISLDSHLELSRGFAREEQSELHQLHISGSNIVSGKQDEAKLSDVELLRRQASIARLEAEKMETMLIIKKMRDLESKIAGKKSITANEYELYRAQIESWKGKISKSE